MEILIDATNERHKKMVESTNPRQHGKTDLSTAYLLAYLESERIGKPVPLSVGYDRLEKCKEEAYSSLVKGEQK